MSADGQTLVFATYLGGSETDVCYQIALDSEENIIIGGETESPDFPTNNGFDTVYDGAGFFQGDGFVAKLSADASALVFGTYVGGNEPNFDEVSMAGFDRVTGLFIDSDDRIYVAGDTGATDFPATSTLHGRQCAEDSAFVVIGDAFVARLQDDGSLDFATCFGGTAQDGVRSIYVDDAGKIYTAGYSVSADAPVTPEAVNLGVDNGAANLMLTVLNNDATQILHAARIGGSGRDVPQNVLVDPTGQVVIHGNTESADFPVTANAYQDMLSESMNPSDTTRPRDAFILSLSPMLSALNYATYIGAAPREGSFGLTLDGDQPVVVLTTTDNQLPTPGGAQTSPAGALNAFSEFESVSNTVDMATGSMESNSSNEFRDNNNGPINFLVAVGNGLNRLYRFTDGGTPVFDSFLAEGSNDTRSVTVFDVDGVNGDDILTANDHGQNYLYFNNGDDGFEPPIAFGSVTAPTRGVAFLRTSISNSDGCVLEFIENQINIAHDFINNEIGVSFPYSFEVTSSRAVATLGASPIQNVVEVAAPDTLNIYRSCNATMGTPPIVLSFPGRDIVDIATGETTSGQSNGGLAFVDANGGGLVIPNLISTNITPITFAGPPALSVALVDDLGVITGHSDGYRFYAFDATESQLATASLTSSTQVDVLAAGGDDVESVFSTSQAVDRYSIAGLTDLYLARFTADGSDIDFATYIGGPSADTSLYGLTMAGPGQALVLAQTTSTAFPVSDDALISTSQGGSDLALIEIAMPTAPVDTDGDGIPDTSDNCSLETNPDQRDTNGDGFGNLCDPDLNNDDIVNVVDLGLLRAAFFSTPGDAAWDADADFNGDDVVNVIDLGVMRLFFFGPPGPGAATATF